MLIGALLCMLGMGILWWRHLATGRADVVDLGWTICVGFLGVFYALSGDADPLRRAMLAVIAGSWSLRLSWYLYATRISKQHEDGRYVTIRAGWGAQANRNFFFFFQAQAVLAVLLAVPMWIVAANPWPLSSVEVTLALALWCISVGGEALADHQLHRFRSNPANRGKTCRDGLWRYSRHPNYFFEWLHWWGYVVLGFSAPWGILTLLSPALMYYLIVYVTGIPPTEARALETRGDDYREYQRTTSALVPWFNKSA